ncbi:hypothetical protein BGP_0234 [Beggiatoa sp. PS]|nr:hypothetical protein BGP_0234 [Beggiatoa sp. PS]
MKILIQTILKKATWHTQPRGFFYVRLHGKSLIFIISPASVGCLPRTFCLNQDFQYLQDFQDLHHKCLVLS